jgi:hypothetical protein
MVVNRRVDAGVSTVEGFSAYLAGGVFLQIRFIVEAAREPRCDREYKQKRHP